MGEDRVPQVDAVVAVLALDDLRDAFEAHAGIDVLRGERRELAAGVAVELDEDEVPDFHHARVFAVDLRPAGFVGRAVDVDFRARAARAGVAHFPEVVFAEVVDVVVALEAVLLPIGDLAPDLGGLGVARDVRSGIAFVAGNVQARRVELPDLRQQFPRHLDGTLLEVVAEGPVAEHFKERVMAARTADVVQVIVLAARADALLRVGDTVPWCLFRAQKIRLELVHPRVGEHQSRVVVRHDRGRRNK